jgi:hypothetical protein
MRIYLCGAATLLTLIAQTSFSLESAFAQESFTNNSTADSSTVYNTAPVHSQRNFKSDARAANLYRYDNPVSQVQQSWNAYQLQVQQLHAQTRATAPIFNQPATSASPSPGTPAYNSLIAASARAFASLLKSSSKAAGSSSGGSISGMPAGPAAGFDGAGSNSAVADNDDSDIATPPGSLPNFSAVASTDSGRMNDSSTSTHATASVVSIDGVVQPPIPEYIPGLLPDK